MRRVPRHPITGRSQHKQQATLHFQAARLVAAVYRCSGRLLGQPVPLQGIEDHIVFTVEEASHALVMHVSLEMIR